VDRTNYYEEQVRIKFRWAIMKEFANTSSKKNDVKTDNSVLRSNKAESFQSHNSAADRILFFQRTIGNQAVQRMVRSGALQAKLKIGQPGDRYEQEADRVAEQVMRMPKPGVQRQVEPEEEEEERLQAKPLANQITPMIQRQPRDEVEEEEILQTQRFGSQSHEIKPDLTTRIQSMKGGGHPLSKSTRSFFEPRFGRDFSQVRVHSGSHAAETAKSIDARAFTVGNNIAFGGGQYTPGSHEGRKLLGHELTHTIQQGATNISPSASTPHYQATDLFITAQNQRSTSSLVQPRKIMGYVPIFPEDEVDRATYAVLAGATEKIEPEDDVSSLIQRQPTGQRPGSQPSGETDPVAVRSPLGSVKQRSPLSTLPSCAFNPANRLIHGPGNVLQLSVPPGVQSGQGFWDIIRDILKPPPCKFWLCKTYKVCKPPKDYWKWWKWKCFDVEICQCALHEVPEKASEGALLTLATLSDNVRVSISASGLMRLVLRIVIGDHAWSLALRILANRPSTTVPTL